MELVEAEWILRFCREFHVLPSQVREEDADLLMLLAIEERAMPEGGA